MSESTAPVPAERLDPVVKAYDIRGLCPEELDSGMCRGLGAAFARFSACPSVVMGRDMRPTGVDLAAAFADGVMSQGVDVIDIGLASTDLLYFASGHLDLPGAMLTASHNPAEYNGIKLCGAGATPVGAESGLMDIKAMAVAGVEYASTHGARREDDLLQAFVAHAHSFVDLADLKPLRIIADTANGMGGHVAPAVFADLPFDVEIMYEELDGSFPNHPADPIQPENLVDLQRRVREVGADVGLAFDGDADRVFLVDEKANPVSGSLTTALVAQGVLAREGPGPVLHNLICSKATAEVIRESGGEPIRTKVGHSFIKAQMAETGAAFGGEHSGHYYFRRNYRADSGLIAALVVLEQLCRSGKALSELLEPLDRYAVSGEINTVVDDAAQVIERVASHYGDRQQDRLDGLTVDCGDWWFNLRPSNTEPLLRLNLEAADAAAVDSHVAEVRALFA
ncbi:MAG: phosphomannomutase/phosphoglucomutase [Actinomycetota bacterium]|jgi:phosphomannomutase|nr:phosphomannomutase/phosphoglucomutase [Actinomycetota bacterium]